MNLQKCLITLLATTSLAMSGIASAALTFWTRGDLMIVHSKAEAGDIERLKQALTPSIKYVVVRGASGNNWQVAKKLADLIEKAGVTTVAHGSCESFTCAMMFLAGEKRLFSGVGRPEIHYVSLHIGETSNMQTEDQTPVEQVVSWWQSHTNLSRGDLRTYHESFFYSQADTIFDRKIFFPAAAGFSKGNTLHCSGEIAKKTGKTLLPVDCFPVKDASALGKKIVTSDDLFIHEGLTEKADIPGPTATDVAKLEDKPIARLGTVCVESYKTFLKQDSPRAFVVSANEACWWANAQNQRPYETALNNCKKGSAGNECRFYAIDEKVVFTPFDQPLPEAAPTKTASK